MANAARGLSAALARARGDAPAWALEAYLARDGRILIIDAAGNAWTAELRTRREANEGLMTGSTIVSRLIPVFGPVPKRGLGIAGRDQVNRDLIASVRALRNQSTLRKIDDDISLDRPIRERLAGYDE